MNIHSLAKTTPIARTELVSLVLEHGQHPREVAEAFRISVRTVHKWLKRFREEGPAGLHDRSSAPRRRPRRLALDIVEEIISLRWLKLTAQAIAFRLNLARSTVGLWLRRLRMSRLRDLEPRHHRGNVRGSRVERYERSQPGELLHLDVKKVRQFDYTGRHYIDRGGRRQRGAKLECIHVCIDDYSRYAYVEVLPRENGVTSGEFLKRAVAHYNELGVHCQEIMTDNGSAYRGNDFARYVSNLGLKHIFTRVRRPQTNGKAERFIQTLSKRWIYVQPYDSSQQRNNLLPAWMAYYNHVRPHSSLGFVPPVSRL